MRHLTRRLAPLAVLSLLALGACSNEAPDAEFEDGAASSSTADAAETPAAGETPAADGGDAPVDGVVGVDFPDPDDVVADATFTVPGTESDEVRIGIQAIPVTDRTMELRLVVTPEFDDDGRAASVYDSFGGTVNIVLIDRANLKEYRVLDATGRRFSTDSVYATALPGASVGFQQFFAAPEDDITTIDVRLHDAWPVFEDVPLTFEN